LGGTIKCNIIFFSCSMYPNLHIGQNRRANRFCIASGSRDSNAIKITVSNLGDSLIYLQCQEFECDDSRVEVLELSQPVIVGPHETIELKIEASLVYAEEMTAYERLTVRKQVHGMVIKMQFFHQCPTQDNTDVMPFHVERVRTLLKVAPGAQLGYEVAQRIFARVLPEAENCVGSSEE